MTDDDGIHAAYLEWNLVRSLVVAAARRLLRTPDDGEARRDLEAVLVAEDQARLAWLELYRKKT